MCPCVARLLEGPPPGLTHEASALHGMSSTLPTRCAFTLECLCMKHCSGNADPEYCSKKYICSRNLRTMLTKAVQAVQRSRAAFRAKRLPMDSVQVVSASLAAESMPRYISNTVRTLTGPGTVWAAGEATLCLKEQCTSLAAGGKALVGDVAGARRGLQWSGEGWPAGGGGAWSSIGGRSRLWEAPPAFLLAFIGGLFVLGLRNNYKMDKFDKRMEEYLDTSTQRMIDYQDKSVQRLEKNVDLKFKGIMEAIERQGKAIEKQAEMTAEALTRLTLKSPPGWKLTSK